MTRFVWLLAVYTRSSIELPTATRHFNNKTLPRLRSIGNPSCMTACAYILFSFSFFAQPFARTGETGSTGFVIEARYWFSDPQFHEDAATIRGLYSIVKVSNFSYSIEFSWLHRKSFCKRCFVLQRSRLEFLDKIIPVVILRLESEMLIKINFVNFYDNIDRSSSFSQFEYIYRF